MIVVALKLIQVLELDLQTYMYNIMYKFVGSILSSISPISRIIIRLGSNFNIRRSLRIYFYLRKFEGVIKLFSFKIFLFQGALSLPDRCSKLYIA